MAKTLCGYCPCMVWLLSMYCVTILHVFVWLEHSVAIVHAHVWLCNASWEFTQALIGLNIANEQSDGRTDRQPENIRYHWA